MSKDILQITISKQKIPKSKFGHWWFWNIYWKVWKIWRPKFLAWMFRGLANFIYWLAPENVKQELDKEFEEVEIVIKDKCDKE